MSEILKQFARFPKPCNILLQVIGGDSEQEFPVRRIFLSVIDVMIANGRIGEYGEVDYGAVE